MAPFAQKMEKESIYRIKHNKIIKIGKIDAKECINVLDCKEKHILPGVIDTQIH